MGGMYTLFATMQAFFYCLYQILAVAMFSWAQTKLQKHAIYSNKGISLLVQRRKLLKTSISLPVSNLKNNGPQPVSEPSSLAISSLADLQGIHRQLPLHEEEKSYSQWKLLPINQSGQHQNIHENVIPLLTTRKKSIAI